MRIAVVECDSGASASAFQTLLSACPHDDVRAVSLPDLASCKPSSATALPFDAVFVATNEPNEEATTSVRELMRRYPKLNVIMVAEHASLLGETLNLHCSGYIVGALTADRIAEELADLRHPIEDPPSKRIFVRCFGTFEVFFDGTPLQTKRTKSKELLALLVSLRGAMCTVGDAEATLWELQPYRPANQSYLRHLACDLHNSLARYGAQNMLVKSRGVMSVNPSLFTCDYYDYLDCIPGAPEYRGQFMDQYSWAEPIRAVLDSCKR